MTIAPPSQRPSASDRQVASSALGRMSQFSVRHRRAVIIFWLISLLAGAMAAGSVSKRLKVDFSLPGQPGYETASRVIQTFGNGGDQAPSILVVTPPNHQSVGADRSQISRAFTDLQQSQPRLRVVDFANTGDARFITKGGQSTYALVFAPPSHSFGANSLVNQSASQLRHSLPGYNVGLTGLNELASGGSTKGPGVFAETMLGALGALAVLAFVFASFLALLPLLIAAVSILTTFLVVLGLTYLTDVSFIVEFLIALIGLGIAIDYSLLVVTRWREERAKGLENSQAVVVASQTAGRSVVLSGLTVAVGLLALIVLPVPGLRSVGIGGVLIPLISTLVVITLLPAILSGIGPRLDWPRVRKDRNASRAWSAWARLVIRWRWLAAGIAILLLALFAIPLFSIKTGQTAVDALAKSGPARTSYNQLIKGGVSPGVLTPIEVLTQQQAAPPTQSTLATVSGITTVALPSGVTGTRSGLSDIIAIPDTATVNNTSLEPVRATQAALAKKPGTIGVTGVGAIQQDYSRAVFGNFPLMFSLIAVITFVLLARALRSFVLAGKAVLLNLLSLAATFGLMVWFWQDGNGSQAIFGIPATGAITFWIPLMVFAFLFGLSMDYEVFILTRMREEYDRSGSTNTAITEGLGRTGRLVTCAALILFLAFASLASAPITDVKVLATGLGIGILLDATVVRALLVPALVAIFGKWNWWYPAFLSSRTGRGLKPGMPDAPQLAASAVDSPAESSAADLSTTLAPAGNRSRV